MFHRVLTVMAAFAVAAVPSFANVAFTANDPAAYTSDGPVTVGSVFTPNVNITVTSLGFYNGGGSFPVTGALVGIYNSTGTLLESVGFSSPSYESGGFAFDSFFTPLALSAGQTYTVASNDVPTGYSYNYTAPPGVDPNITFDTSTYTYGGGLNFPTSHFLEVYYGPNFEFNTATTTTPEPGFYGVLALGLAGLITAVRRRNRA